MINLMALVDRRWAAEPQQPDLARHGRLFGALESRSDAIYGILAAFDWLQGDSMRFVGLVAILAVLFSHGWPFVAPRSGHVPIHGILAAPIGLKAIRHDPGRNGARFTQLSK